MLYDENLSPAEIMLINQLKNKTRMEQDEILGNYKKKGEQENAKF